MGAERGAAASAISIVVLDLSQERCCVHMLMAGAHALAAVKMVADDLGA